MDTKIYPVDFYTIETMQERYYIKYIIESQILPECKTCYYFRGIDHPEEYPSISSRYYCLLLHRMTDSRICDLLDFERRVISDF